MKTYDFDQQIDRSGTWAIKHCRLEQVFGRADIIPLWVADMDFATPDFIMDALRQRLENPVLGYTATPDDYWPTVARWIREHHDWEIQTEWMAFIPGIVKGIGMVVNVFCRPGDKVIIQPPVYHPFRIVPQGNGCEIVWNPLRQNDDGSYSMDFDHLEQVCDEHCRLLILSNPHNPAGICWDRDTLQRLAHFCTEHHLLVVSDEIHCDMALFGHRHIPFASVSDEAARCSITFGAPTKTFNIAGVVSSYCIIPDEQLRSRFFGWLEANELDFPPMFSPLVTQVAFTQGEPWRQQMVRYIEGNVDFVVAYCAQYLPQIRPLRPQASYLVWLDCRGLGLNHDQLQDLFIQKAHLALNDGEMFGPGGEGFMRMNVGCPRAVLQQALKQLSDAVSAACPESAAACQQ